MSYLTFLVEKRIKPTEFDGGSFLYPSFAFSKPIVRGVRFKHRFKFSDLLSLCDNCVRYYQ